jgi:ribosomal protein S18 acetylase RimI-like enzyme
MQILFGLPNHLIANAADLYWAAFGGNLGLVLGPKPKAIAFLTRVMRPDHCIIAVQDGRLIGMVGLQSPRGSFAGGEARDIWAIYGLILGLWRFLLLYWLGGNGQMAQLDGLMIEGFCVRPDARGQGVGASLLHASIAYAQSLGCRHIQLEVTDQNPRARSFYESHGFSLLARRSIWPFHRLFGFAHIYTMKRPL